LRATRVVARVCPVIKTVEATIDERGGVHFTADLAGPGVHAIAGGSADAFAAGDGAAGRGSGSGRWPAEVSVGGA
jgi:hypothetical protein